MLYNPLCAALKWLCLQLPKINALRLFAVAFYGIVARGIYRTQSHAKLAQEALLLFPGLVCQTLNLFLREVKAENLLDIGDADVPGTVSIVFLINVLTDHRCYGHQSKRSCYCIVSIRSSTMSFISTAA